MSFARQPVVEKAMVYLARREHSVLELTQKLLQKGYTKMEVEPAIHYLIQERLLSNERFTEQWVHHKQNRGYGPRYLAFELTQKGISAELIDRYVWSQKKYFEQSLRNWMRKKMHGSSNTARCVRYLLQKGFLMEDIIRAQKKQGQEDNDENPGNS
jgi:regulatory protein